MIIDANGSVRVFFAQTYRDATEIPLPSLVVFPDRDTGWNDFSYKFFAHLHLFRDAPGNAVFSAPMRLMFRDQDDTIEHLQQLFSRHGPLIPCESLGNSFCSILIKDDYYRRLVAALTLEEAVHGLRQLGDAVVLEADQGSDSRLELIRSKAFHLGALRQSDAYSAWRRAKRHLRQNPPEPVDDAASNFSAKIKLPWLKSHYEMSIDFNKKELLRNRIAVLIGRNGVGKTQCLLSIIKTATNPSFSSKDMVPGAIAEAEFNPAPTFNSILTFSSVSSDLYPESIAPWEGGVDYSYFSLIARDGRDSNHAIDTVTASLADIVRSKDTFESPGEPNHKQRRADILQKALAPHINYRDIYLPLSPETPGNLVWATTLSSGRYVSLWSISGEMRTVETVFHIDWARPPIIMEDEKPRRLSSGQLAMLRFAAQAIGSVQQGSLLLMDEPETHLHPNYISVLVEILHIILEATRSCAIIATHSAYIVREVPRSRVLVLKEEDGTAEVSQPRLQTFGASIDSISNFVFGDAEIEHLHEILLRQWLGDETNIEEVLKKHGTELNPESLSYIRRVLSRKGHQ